MATVLERVQQYIARHALVQPGDGVVVGVSGGPDSLCLLHLLCRLQETLEISLHLAHLHHGLRGAEADADAEFVGKLATDWGLSCTVEREDVPGLARDHRLAIEEAARRARYSFLRRVALSIGAETIAVGHNADDQAETVLMHWIRGSGLAGLRGMLPSTPLTDYRLFEGEEAATESVSCDGLSAVKPLQLIRPLLEIPRAEIEDYCGHYGLEPRFDRSNLDTTYFRNWLRHQVLPLLAQHNPNVREVIWRTAKVIADDYALLRAHLEEAWPGVVIEEPSLPATPSREAVQAEQRIVFDLAAWRALPTALQRSTLREAIHRLRYSLRNINFLHVENALVVARDGTTGDQATLPRGLMLTLDYERFTIADADTAEPEPDWPLLPVGYPPLPVPVPGSTPLPDSDWVLHVTTCDRADLLADWEANDDPWRAFLDAAAVGGDTWLRTRMDGDAFQPLGMGGHTVKLADFLTNQKVPRNVRGRLPLLIGKKGIVWVCGYRIDERARIRVETKKVLVLSFVCQ